MRPLGPALPGWGMAALGVGVCTGAAGREGRGRSPCRVLALPRMFWSSGHDDVALGAAPEAQLFGDSSAWLPPSGYTWRPAGPRTSAQSPRPAPSRWEGGRREGSPCFQVLGPPPPGLGCSLCRSWAPALPGRTVAKPGGGKCLPLGWSSGGRDRVPAQGCKCCKDPRTSGEACGGAFS